MSEPLPARVRWSRVAFRVGAVLFLLALGVQAYLAGAAVLSDATYWASHKTFVHAFEFVPIILLVLAFVGRGTPGLMVASFLGWFLIGLQYALAGLRPSPVAGLHAVNAMVLVGLALALVAARPRPAASGWARMVPAWKE